MNNNETRKRVRDLTIGDVFLNTATRVEVLSNTLAEKRTPTGPDFRNIETCDGVLRVPADLLVKVL